MSFFLFLGLDPQTSFFPPTTTNSRFASAPALRRPLPLARRVGPARKKSHIDEQQQSLSPPAASSSSSSEENGAAAQPAKAAAATPPPPPPPKQKGAKLVPLAASVGIGLALRFLVPVPAGLEPQAWSLLSVFVSTIAGLVLEPLPTGAWAAVAATAAVASGALDFAQAFSAFRNDVIWLIVVSFFFAAGFQKTGLGERVATLFVRAFGSSTLGLAYGLAAAEAVVAPAMPSTTARAGGIFLPIIDSLARASGSFPGEKRSCRERRSRKKKKKETSPPLTTHHWKEEKKKKKKKEPPPPRSSAPSSSRPSSRAR